MALTLIGIFILIVGIFVLIKNKNNNNKLTGLLFGFIVLSLYLIFTEKIIILFLSYTQMWFFAFVLLAFVVISSYFYTYKFYGSAKVILWSKIVLVILALMVILNFLLITLASEKRHKAQEKQLKIELINDKPCFYIDEFDGIDDFDVKGIGVRTELPSREWTKTEHMWFAGVIRKDTHSMKSFRLSTISDVSKCIPYGIKNDITSAPSQKLKTDVLYEVYMDGVKKSVNKDKDHKYGIWLYGTFYLSRNPKTGKLEVNMLNNTETNVWFNKIKDQNKGVR